MEYDAVLVYDGECPYCSVTAGVFRRLEDVGVVSWYDDAAQDLLAAQFDEVPFAMFLVDVGRERVYAGRAAAEELVDRAGMPDRLGSLARKRYDDVSAIVGRLSDRHRAPDDYHAIYPLAPAARERFDALLAAATDEAEAAAADAGA